MVLTRPKETIVKKTVIYSQIAGLGRGELHAATECEVECPRATPPPAACICRPRPRA
jgi:hypothetical protein